MYGLTNDLETAGPEQKTASVEQTDLRALIQHQEWVDAATPLGVIYSQFQTHQHEFCAVKRHGKLLGLCSSSQVGFLMGHRYGYAIYSKHPVSDHLVEHPVIIELGTPIRTVLEKSLGRRGKAFNEDVVLVGPGREYLGLITVPALVRLQSALVEERFRAQEALHQRLMTVSRQAGMAEVATGILHNVGNVLNSVNVSVTLLREMKGRSRLVSLEKAAELIQKNRPDIGTYVTSHDKGKLLPDLIVALAERMRQEQNDQTKEVESLARHIEHIKNIVGMQQRYAKQSGVLEPIQISALLEDAIELNANAFVRHGIKLERQFETVPSVIVDKHKILQIFVNLLRNAKQALDAGKTAEKHVKIRIHTEDNFVKIHIQDNGIGIPSENLERIFGHGFTTKKDGHGFGLHSCALAAREMGGSLCAESDGPETGATFTLALPITPPKKKP